MNNDEIHELAVRCLSTALGRVLSADEELVLSDSGEWDSLKHVELLFVVEDETGVIMEPDQLSSIVDLQSLEAALATIVSGK